MVIILNNRLAVSDEKITERELNARRFVRKAAAEGAVLLKNDRTLPLGKSIKKIALFGAGAGQTVRGGTGSGDVNVRSYVTVREGLSDAGYEIVTDRLLKRYDCDVSAAKALFKSHIQQKAADGVKNALIEMMHHPFTAPEFICPESFEGYEADAAIYVLSRISGEGADRKAVPSDYMLGKTELRDIKRIASFYDKFVLVLNIAAPIDMSELCDAEDINAVLLIGQGGSESGSACADIISGKASPSGKLTSTWARKYSDYPFADEFAGLNGDVFDSYYKEDIFVGYRYFDSFKINPLYPFGFGLSYTDFELSTDSFEINGENIEVGVRVRNIGDVFSGKEVVEIYAEPPVGNLAKPLKSLAAFAKTRELAPGEEQRMTVSFSACRLASYNEDTSEWVIEKGCYVMALGNSSDNLKEFAVVDVSADIVCERCKALFRGEKVGELHPNRTPRNTPRHLIRKELRTENIKTVEHTYRQDTKISDAVSALSVQEAAVLCVGSARISSGKSSVIGIASKSIPGAAGDTTPLLAKKGIPQIIMADGPAGIRVNPKVYVRGNEYVSNPAEDPIFSMILPKEMQNVDLSGTVKKYQYCTALPVASTLAQSWNTELIERTGDVIGAEMELLGISLWLSPAMNIQRNPLCGRNFEYYSEDPLLSGLCAAAAVRGIEKHNGCAATIKHLAANNQETNRNYNNSRLSERALREIYLKAFEICVKEARPSAAMSSLNLINGVHAANDRDLLTSALRCEWGFDGFVMTDWGTTNALVSAEGQKYPVSSSAGCIKAGNDLIMPGSQGDVDRILEAVNDGELSVQNIKLCADRIYRTIIKLCGKENAT